MNINIRDIRVVTVTSPRDKFLTNTVAITAAREALRHVPGWVYDDYVRNFSYQVIVMFVREDGGSRGEYDEPGP